jgi:hypothetical protein
VSRDHQDASGHIQPIERQARFGRSGQLALREGWRETRTNKNG